MPDTSDLIEDEFLNHATEFIDTLAALEPEFWPRHLQRRGVANAIASTFNGLPLEKQKAIILSIQRLLADRARPELSGGSTRFADSLEAEQLRQSDRKSVV